MHPVPCGPQAAPGPDEGVVLHRFGQNEMAAGPQHPADLAQHAVGLLEVMEHVDAPHQTDAGIGKRQLGAVGDRHRRLAKGLGGAVLVVLDADRAQAR